MNSISKSFSLLLILVLAVSTLIIAKPAFAQTILTATTLDTINTPPVGALIVPDQYPTIQDAINNASSGDTVYVKEGIYKNVGDYQLIINKPLSLVGQDSQKTVIISNSSYYDYYRSAIQVESSYVTIEDFTIACKGAEMYGINLNPDMSPQPSYCKILNNLISSNFQTTGIATGENSEGNVVMGNTIANNSCGIFEQSSNSLIADNMIFNNSYQGISASGQNITISGNYIMQNGNSNYAQDSPEFYGGIYLAFGSDFKIFGNNITDSHDFGVEFYWNCSNAEVYDNNITGNDIGAYAPNFDLTLESPRVGVNNVVFRNNFVDNGKNALVQYECIYNLTMLKQYNSDITGNGTDVVSWDNGKVGNYWSDYSGHGVYVIGAKNTDYHPLTQQVNISTTAPTAPTLLSTAFAIAIIAIVVVLTVVVSLLLYMKRRRIAFSQTKVTPTP